MHDEIVQFLREQPEGVDSVTLAQQFLKFKSPDPALAHIAVSAMLKSEPRCAFVKGRWITRSTGVEGTPLSGLPCVAIHLLSAPNDPLAVFHVAAWQIHPQPTPIVSAWIRDPATLAEEEQAILASSRDKAYSADQWDSIRDQIVAAIEKSIPIYLSWKQQSLLMREFSLSGDQLPDDGITVGQLLKSAGVALPRPLTVPSLCAAVGSVERTGGSAFSQGNLFAESVSELLSLLQGRGITTFEEIRRKEEESVKNIDFAGKAFTRDDILKQPEAPGVYAFRNAEGQYLYIGKSRNLRRRLLGYFQPSDESPAKLDRLRREAHSLTVHVCGSELESLIYEFRLIRKHSPILNSQTEIHERQGAFRLLPDCVALLDHPQKGMVMSFWFKHGEKVMLKPVPESFPDSDQMSRELEEFFFTDTLPDKNDFAEDEIAFRWLKRHAEGLPIVRADSAADGKELYEAMRISWMSRMEI